ncbi:MAG: S-layer homology domain-containing protein [Candidatus Limnocylindrales bacterium]
MRITIELRRPAQRSVVLTIALLLLVVPGVALASHQFLDVPNSNPFHDDIGAIAEAGITTGFGDGNYHPSDPVTRQAMAAFMHRGFGRVALADGAAVMTASVDVLAGSVSSSFVPVRQVTIEVPGQNTTFNPNQLVFVHGRVTLLADMTSNIAGCACEFAARIKDPFGNLSGIQTQTFFAGATTDLQQFEYYLDVDALFTIPPGSRTFELQVSLNNRDISTSAYSFNLADRSALSAMTFPFGSTGTNDY